VLLSEYTNTLRIPDHVQPSELAGLIATGGNIEALADLAGAPTDDAGVSRLPTSDLRKTAKMLARMTVDERIEHLGLREDRADVILPAAVIYGQVARLIGAEAFVVPRVGVREGVLLDLADDITGPAVHASRLEQLAFRGALALGQRFRFDELHGRHVARLSLSLFDQLDEVHALGEEDRRILLVAAALHDVGQFISYRKHHKHSLYLIFNSDIPGLSRHQRILASLVARYHRRAEPKDEHFLFAELDASDRERVRRMASLLRLADALDREHLQRVPAVEARVADGALFLEMDGRGDLLLEHWSLRKKSRMFTSVFDLEVHPVRTSSVGPKVI
jgi:exopolyphosphatase/guanosine-5'-triphosphate,3'-diphosphate pyrophosphatase